MKFKSIDAQSWKCPQCGKNYFTDSAGYTTLAYYPPTYKDGVNINPDRNTTSFRRHCQNCGYSFDISGNDYDEWDVSVVKKMREAG
jgi:rubredoxin